MVFGVIVYASTLSLTVIAVDRFALIVVGVKRRLSPRVALALVLVIAAFSATAEDRREPYPTVSDRLRPSPTVADCCRPSPAGPCPRHRRLLDGRRPADGALLAPRRLRRPGPAHQTAHVRGALAVDRHPEAVHRRAPPLPVVAASS